MVEPHVIFTHSLQKPKSTLNIRRDKRLRIEDGIIIMRFGSKMDDCILACYRLIHRLCIADIAFNKSDLPAHTVKVMDIAGISKQIQDCNLHFRMPVCNMPDEICANEPCPARHKDTAELLI